MRTRFTWRVFEMAWTLGSSSSGEASTEFLVEGSSSPAADVGVRRFRVAPGVSNPKCANLEIEDRARFAGLKLC